MPSTRQEREAKYGFLKEGWNAKQIQNHLGVDRSTAYRRMQTWRAVNSRQPLNLFVGYDTLQVECQDNVWSITIEHSGCRGKSVVMNMLEVSSVVDMLSQNKVQQFDIGPELTNHPGYFRAFQRAADQINFQW